MNALSENTQSSKPAIAIVTPSYNQARFLEATMISVLNQGYPRLDYMVVDGNSNDDSAGIIEKYADRLKWWVSEPDSGQYDAINKGFSHTDAEIMGWLNSDDMHFPWTLSVVAEIFSTFPEVEWITSQFPLLVDSEGRVVKCKYRPGYTRKGFFRGENLPGGKWYSTGWLQQESTFWRRSLWERAGGYIDASFSSAGDYELWARFFQNAGLYTAQTPLAAFRSHGEQKTGLAPREYFDECEQVMRKYSNWPGGPLTSFSRAKIIPQIVNRSRRLALLSGIASKVKTIVYEPENGKWQIITI